MICPNCGAEYQPGFTRCPDCMVDLIDADPAPAAPRRNAAPADQASSTNVTLGADVTLGAAGTPGWRPMLRWLLAAVLACFVVVRVIAAVRFDFLVTGQSASYYAVNALIDLGPVVVETVAIVLALRQSGGRLAWGILLALGLTLFAFQSYYALTAAHIGTGIFEGIALVGLALLQFPRSAEARAETR